MQAAAHAAPGAENPPTAARSGSGRRLALVRKACAVVRVADHRMADMRHVDADLVGAAGLQPAFDERRPWRLRPPRRKRSQHRVVGDGMAGIVAALRHDGAPHAVARRGRAARRWCRALRAGAPQTSAMIGALQVAGAAMVGKGLRQRPWARSVLATTMTPLVSLSRRWTMPGRLTPPMPDRLSPQ